tara:strand:- start:765 stop:1394 length:630 start_codon:yes stop_codon:yes gene_type:complete
MKQLLFLLLALSTTMPVLAEDTRQLDAHEHGVGTLDIAIEKSTVTMEFHAPGADIVGFEYEAKSDADLAAIDSATEILGAPLDLFIIPDAAACTVIKAHAELESEDDHDEHNDEAHDDHAKEGHDDHAEDGHNDNDDEGHKEHAEEPGHTEFHAEYTLACENLDALTEITFAYFEIFPNAKEVEVQIITAKGAQAFEVEHDAPVLNLRR